MGYERKKQKKFFPFPLAHEVAAKRLIRLLRPQTSVPLRRLRKRVSVLTI